MKHIDKLERIMQKSVIPFKVSEYGLHITNCPHGEYKQWTYKKVGGAECQECEHYIYGDNKSVVCGKVK